MSEYKSPYQRIMIAANKGVGLRLSLEEVFQLSLDTTIRQAAENQDEKSKEDQQ